ncbi:MAG TPA: multicopper oxidase domain-containing protein [Bryobacteraceae bacterium]|nr:multicopper oxidase domain-containing protein [Bryobacteraceae bacterium]
MTTRRRFIQAAATAAPAVLLALPQQEKSPDYTIEIAPYSLEASPHHTIKTTAYNAQVPGPLLRFKQGRPVTINVKNQTKNSEVVHWHGLFLPSEVDGAMEEGTPPIPPAQTAHYSFTPDPAGFRWYHTHTFAGSDLNKGQYTAQHGFLLIEPPQNPARYDAEIFLALHDWRGQLLGGGDGSMDPSYDLSTINGRVLGFGEPIRVKNGQRALLHILNSSPTEVHWLSFSGHQFQVLALDGNPVPKPALVPMLRLAPAERVSALVQMNNPGVWVLGEARKHIRNSGMGIVVEYADRSGQPKWQEPAALSWDYLHFAAPLPGGVQKFTAITIPLVFRSKFAGHGDMDRWTINGKSYPDTETVVLRKGQRYRLQFKNESTNDHPVHLHRHLFELAGIPKDTVLVPANTQVEVEFVANDPGATLFHCHQQNHMDNGFMMLFRYA